MPQDTGITLLFRDERIYIRRGTMKQLGQPNYIHILINEKEKHLYIQACDKDKDAFRVNYYVTKCCICSKVLIRYLATVVGVPFPYDSLNYTGVLMDDMQTVFIDLRNYTVIPYDGEYKEMTYHEKKD